VSDREFLLGEISLVLGDLYAIAKKSIAHGDLDIARAANETHATMLGHLTAMLQKERSSK
jgi:hypothetical protein